MKDQAARLALLSKCDFELHQLRSSIATPPKELTDIQKKLKPEEKKQTDIQMGKELLEKRIRELQKMILLENEKLKIAENQLNNPKGQKVFLKVKSNIDIIRRFIKDSERRILAYEKKIDDFNARFKEAQSTIDELKKKEEAIMQTFGSQNKESLAKIEELEKQRPPLSKEIKPKLLYRYNKLLERGLQPVVSEVKTNHCGACSIEFPPKVFQDLLSESIGECSNCLRILVVDYSEDEPKEKDGQTESPVS